MARWFGRGDDNSNMNMGFSFTGRRVLLVFALLVIAGLITGAFIYGNQKRQSINKPAEPVNQPVAAPEAGQSAQPNQTQTSGGQGSQAAPGSNSTPAPAQPGPSASNPTTSAPAGGTQAAVPNTGAEDYAPAIGTIVVLLGWQYRRSRRSIAQAQLNS